MTRLSPDPARVCSVEGCSTRALARGWCSKHYQRFRVHGDPHTSLLDRENGPTCTIDDCEKPSHSRGWCRAHYALWAKHGDPLKRVQIVECRADGCDTRQNGSLFCPAHEQVWYPTNSDLAIKEQFQCSVSGCGLMADAKTLCVTHYQRWRKHGTTDLISTCPVCKTPFTRDKGNKRYCSVACRTEASLRRAKTWRSSLWDITRGEGASESSFRRVAYRLLAERSNGRCVICGETVDLELRSGVLGEELGPSIEHLIPRSSFDDDDPRRDSPLNLALSHWACNRDRKVAPLIPRALTPQARKEFEDFTSRIIG